MKTPSSPSTRRTTMWPNLLTEEENAELLRLLNKLRDALK